jgi:peptide/nickel transport system permease protein
VATAPAVGRASSFLQERLLREIERARKFAAQVTRNKLALAGLVIIAVFVLMSIAAPLLVGAYPAAVALGPTNQPPSSAHLLGTDKNGYDILTLLVYGGRVSLVIGFVSSAVAMLLGTSVGLLAGYYGRLTDQVLARATDFFLVIPWLPFAIVIVALLGPTLSTIIIAIAVVSWPTTARVIRAQVLTIKERRFIERAKAIGAGNGHIIWRHILPNVLPLVWAEAVLTISSAVFTEAFLAFFGFTAADPGSPKSWGTIVNEAYQSSAAFRGMWWWLIPPGLLITVIVLGFAMLGYGLEEILNPPLKRR